MISCRIRMMKDNSAATIFAAIVCLISINTVIAPFAMAEDLPVATNSAPAATGNDFNLIVPDVTNCSIPNTAPYASADPPAPAVTAPDANTSAVPGLESFDLSASRSYNMPAPPSNDLLPAQSVDSASTPNLNGQMPAIPAAPQAALPQTEMGLPQTAPTETQTAADWRRAAFESLTSNPNVQPMFGRTQAQIAAADASANGTAAGGVNNDPNSNANANNGQPGNNLNAAASGMTPSAPPVNMGMNSPPVQSQTLTGPSSNQQYGQTAKRGNGTPGGGTASSGMSSMARYASMFTMMGGGLMMGSMMRR